MSAVSVSTNTLPSNVPKLDPKGTNWVIFSIRFKDAITTKKKWGHFDGTAPCPSFTVATGATLSEKQLTTIQTWNDDEASAKYLLSQRLPDSTVIRTNKIAMIATHWASIVTDYTAKSAFAQTALRKEFLDLCMPRSGDVDTFFKDLAAKKEKLATCGSSAEKKFDIQVLMDLVVEEYEHLTREQGANTGGSNSSSNANDVALLVMGGSGERGKSKRPFQGACWNCGEKGHIWDKCPKLKKTDGSSSSKSGLKTTGSANVAVDYDSNSDGFWIAESMSGALEVDDDEGHGSMLSLYSVSGSDASDSVPTLDDDEGGWFSEMEEDEGGEFEAWAGDMCPEVYGDVARDLASSISGVNPDSVHNDTSVTNMTDEPELSAAVFPGVNSAAYSRHCHAIFDSGAT
ncbi:hypothetical protein HETIRDRAFT_115390 [Heterobasidion irregulare TC 32-1]|uniref:CCHC-type domain-containing protein n=1 Tax=Heterobasidion irregulare (strain TC 32-1) TaxID=747525 RepID=W4KH85_HETIT|nr:uncharacterized protein HETIRDRAFT_115390 [Heterobasidion irregulare TC 32-1]ETW85218.1 hypothetical protein HETIRDRAFT_115390 [Heterobasidion irregulare TC 32-1]